MERMLAATERPERSGRFPRLSSELVRSAAAERKLDKRPDGRERRAGDERRGRLVRVPASFAQVEGCEGGQGPPDAGNDINGSNLPGLRPEHMSSGGNGRAVVLRDG